MASLSEPCGYIECSEEFNPLETKDCMQDDKGKWYCNAGCRGMAALDAATLHQRLRESGLAYIVERKQMIAL